MEMDLSFSSSQSISLLPARVSCSGSTSLSNFGVGSIAAVLGGYLVDRFGLDSVFYAMGGCFAAASMLLLWLFIRTAAHAR